MNIIYRHKKRRKAYVPPNIEIQEFASEGALMMGSGTGTGPNMESGDHGGGNERSKEYLLFDTYYDDDFDEFEDEDEEQFNW